MIERVEPARKTNPKFGAYEMLAVTDLHTDGTYQRPLSPWRVRDIVLNYEPILFQPLIIGFRKGVYYVVDGQHRLEAAKQLGFTEVPCMLYETKTVAEEAKAFVWLQQHRRRITVPQKFIARIAYGDVAAVAIADLMKKHGFEIGGFEGFGVSQRGNNRIIAVTSLERAYEEGGAKRVDDLLFVLRTAYDGRASALERTIIQGLARYMAENAYSRVRLAECLRDIAPFDLLGGARSVSHQRGITPNEALSACIGNLYRGAPMRAKSGLVK